MIIRKKKRIITAVAAISALSVVFTGCGDASADKNEQVKKESGIIQKEGTEVILKKSEGANPLFGDEGTGNYTYGGDPSVLVDKDTVYLYVGHDESTNQQVQHAIYNMKNYLCYSTQDMVHWKEEGSVMEIADAGWADEKSAWASQVVRHYDKATQKDRYYLYFCSWDKEASRKQSIGVAVADTPTGPFVDIGHSLVKGTFTTDEVNAWEDIDPTVWIETDENGEEHRYLAWGNSRFFICELNEDMISVKDRNGDGEITFGYDYDAQQADIVNHQSGLRGFTEAPWIYRRQDANGNYYGDYYLFYANGWFENMAYATTDNLMDGTWKFGNIIMGVTATSNTNHMAVFDFDGQTYFAYHNGSLPAGNGYRRSACLTKLEFEDDGSVVYMQETASGLNGQVVRISDAKGGAIAHEAFVNSTNSNGRPYTDIALGIGKGKNEADEQWVLKKGYADESNDTYVSIESENKPGLYLTASEEDDAVVLSQNMDAAEETAKAQTFHSVVGLSDESGVSFESVLRPGQYLTVAADGSLLLTDGEDKENATFYVEEK